VTEWVLRGVLQQLSPNRLEDAILLRYRPTTTSVKLSFTIVGRGCGFSAVGLGVSPNSAVGR